MRIEKRPQLTTESVSGIPLVHGDKFRPNDYILDKFRLEGLVSDLTENLFELPYLKDFEVTLNNTENTLTLSAGEGVIGFQPSSIKIHDSEGNIVGEPTLPRMTIAIQSETNFILNLPTVASTKYVTLESDITPVISRPYDLNPSVTYNIFNYPNKPILKMYDNSYPTISEGIGFVKVGILTGVPNAWTLTRDSSELGFDTIIERSLKGLRFLENRLPITIWNKLNHIIFVDQTAPANGTGSWYKPFNTLNLVGLLAGLGGELNSKTTIFLLNWTNDIGSLSDTNQYPIQIQSTVKDALIEGSLTNTNHTKVSGILRATALVYKDIWFEFAQVTDSPFSSVSLLNSAEVIYFENCVFKSNSVHSLTIGSLTLTKSIVFKNCYFDHTLNMVITISGLQNNRFYRFENCIFANMVSVDYVDYADPLNRFSIYFKNCKFLGLLTIASGKVYIEDSQISSIQSSQNHSEQFLSINRCSFTNPAGTFIKLWSTCSWELNNSDLGFDLASLNNRFNGVRVLTKESQIIKFPMTVTLALANNWNTNNLTLVANSSYRINCISGSFSLKLPPTPAVNSKVILTDVANSFGRPNSLTIQRNGELIEGLAEDLVCNIPNSYIELEFFGGNRGWVLITKQRGNI